MKQIISAKDIEELLRGGGDVKSLPSDAILTPSARDLLRDIEGNGAPAKSSSVESGAGGAAKAVTASSSQADLDAFFNSREIHSLKEQLCDVGRRLWQRAY